MIICTRRLSDGTGSSEPSLPLKVPDNTDETDIVQATWMTDPRVHEVPGLTVKRLMLLVNRGGSYCGELWSSTHSVTKHKIHLQQRVDRHLLISIFEQTRQILQLRLDQLGPIDDQRQQLPKESEVLKKGISIMQPLAEKYCRGEVSKDDLKQARDTAIKESGFTIFKQAAMKKPACSKEPVPKKPGTEKESIEKEPGTEKEDEASDTKSTSEKEPEPTTDKELTTEKKPSTKKGGKLTIMKKPAGVKPAPQSASSSACPSSSSTAPGYEALPPPPVSFFFSEWLSGR